MILGFEQANPAAGGKAGGHMVRIEPNGASFQLTDLGWKVGKKEKDGTQRPPLPGQKGLQGAVFHGSTSKPNFCLEITCLDSAP